MSLNKRRKRLINSVTSRIKNQSTVVTRGSNELLQLTGDMNDDARRLVTSIITQAHDTVQEKVSARRMKLAIDQFQETFDLELPEIVYNVNLKIDDPEKWREFGQRYLECVEYFIDKTDAIIEDFIAGQSPNELPWSDGFLPIEDQRTMYEMFERKHLPSFTRANRSLIRELESYATERKRIRVVDPQSGQVYFEEIVTGQDAKDISQMVSEMAYEKSREYAETLWVSVFDTDHESPGAVAYVSWVLGFAVDLDHVLRMMTKENYKEWLNTSRDVVYELFADESSAEMYGVKRNWTPQDEREKAKREAVEQDLRAQKIFGGL